MASPSLAVRNDVCPNQEVLAAYCVGRLQVRALEAVADHVMACVACQSSVAALNRDSEKADSLIEKLRRSIAQAPRLVCQADDPARTVTLAQDTKSRTDADEGALDAARAQPSNFGQYELLAEIGHGGMGRVYKARQVRLNRLVAVKVIQAGAGADREQRDRFCIEGEAVARLQHPNVVQVHEFGEHAGQLYLCMEFLEGGSLANKVQGAGLPLRDAAQLVQTLATALQAAHDRQIVHRDLKPANVLLAADGTPKIGDFGLAKLLDAEEQLTQTGDVLGTPSYMAPEQASGRLRDIGVWTDIWALGAILYECLTGKPPYKGANKKETLEWVIKRPCVPPRLLRREVPVELEDICLKCLEKALDQRPASAAEVAADLQNWLDGKATRLHPRRGLWRLAYQARRHPLWAASLVSCAITAAVLAYVLHPDRPLWQMQRTLDQGDEVVLLGPTGAPTWWRWVTGQDRSTVSQQSDGAFVVQGWTETMVELLPDTRGISHYTVRAEIQHLRGGDNSLIGLYFAHGRQTNAKVPAFSFLQLDYDDLHDVADQYDRLPPEVQRQLPRPKNHVKLLTSCRSRTDGPALRNLFRSPCFDVEAFKPSGFTGQVGKWRTVSIEVSPINIKIDWDGQLATNTDPAKVRLLNQAQLDRGHLQQPNDPNWAGLTPVVNLQGGIGLYLHDSSGAFRNVRITPIR